MASWYRAVLVVNVCPSACVQRSFGVKGFEKKNCGSVVFSMKFTKSAQYLNATNQHIFPHFFKEILMKFIIPAQYHDLSNMTLFYFFFIFPMELMQRIQYHDKLNNTKYLFFHGIPHEFHLTSSIPRNYTYRNLSYFFRVYYMQFTKTAQYHDASNNTHYLIFRLYLPMKFTKLVQYLNIKNSRLSHFFFVFSILFTKLVYFHNNANITQYFIFS